MREAQLAQLDKGGHQEFQVYTFDCTIHFCYLYLFDKFVMCVLHHLGKDGARGEDGEVGLPGVAGSPGK